MKKSVCILFGGKSEEYEVSLRSAYSVLCSIDTDKYEISKIGVTRDGRWLRFLGSNAAFKYGDGLSSPGKGRMKVRVKFGYNIVKGMNKS